MSEHRHFQRRCRTEVIEQRDISALGQMRRQLVQNSRHRRGRGIERDLFDAGFAVNAQAEFGLTFRNTIFFL